MLFAVVFEGHMQGQIMFHPMVTLSSVSRPSHLAIKRLEHAQRRCRPFSIVDYGRTCFLKFDLTIYIDNTNF